MTIEAAQAAMKVLYRQRQEEELKGDLLQEFPKARERFLRQDSRSFPPVVASRLCASVSNVR